VYDGLLTWLENAEHEYDRRSFAGIVAAENPGNTWLCWLPTSSLWATHGGVPGRSDPFAHS